MAHHKTIISQRFDKFRRFRWRSLGIWVIVSAFFLFGFSICFLITPPKAVLPLPEPKADGGHAWVIPVPELSLSPWQRILYVVYPGYYGRNDVTLFEDGRPLPAPNCLVQDIRDKGAGRYSHWLHDLWFSTSSNDDPRLSGRVYTIEIRSQLRKWVYRTTWLAFLGIVFMLLPKRLKTRLKTEWQGLKSAWKLHSGQRLPDKLRAVFLKPETANESGFPAGKVLGPGFWTRQAPCLAGAALLALLAWYFRANAEMIDWVDAVGYYQSQGRSLMERGTPVPSALPYEVFIEQGTNGPDPSYRQNFGIMPSIGFQLLVGFLGKWRGDYSQANGLLAAAAFSVLFAVALYIFGFTHTRSRLLSFGLVLACLAHPTLTDVTGRPLTDITLLFFLFAALLPMSKGKSLFSGFIFGLGCLFRSAGLYYLPVLALASPKSVTWRGYARSTLAAGLGVAFWLAINRGLLIFLTRAGDISTTFYLSFSGVLGWFGKALELVNSQSFKHALHHLFIFAWQVNPLILSSKSPDFSDSVFLVFFILILTLGFTFRLTTPLGRRLVIIGLWTLLVPCLTFMFYGMDHRHGIYAVALFWTAMVLAANRFRWPLWVAILLLMIIYSPPSLPNVNMEALRGLSRPGAAWRHITEPMRAKMRLERCLKPESVILSSWLIDEMVFSRPRLLFFPGYETWRNSRGNERIDAITFFNRERPHGDWPIDDEVLEDVHGVRFVSFKGFGDYWDSLKPEYQIYLREQPSSTAGPLVDRRSP